VVGYPAGQSPDTPPGFTVFPNKCHLDKGRQATDIADILSREVSEIERDKLQLIVEPSVLHLIVRRQFKPRHIKMKGDSK
jgi:hypothetical protein